MLQNSENTVSNGISKVDITRRKYTPVVIFTYNRASHTRDLLNSLSNCILAGETDVYIFADGPKKPNDDAVNAVRSLINEDSWKHCFKSLTITESEANKGLANSVISGVSKVIDQFGKVLVLEDDLAVSKYLLVYMNQALDHYEKDMKIFSIAGWAYPIKGLKTYNKDAWIFYRACSWGWATWKDRWQDIVWDHDKAGFADKLNSKEWVNRFCRGGNDLPGMLKMQLEGKRDSWAIRWNAASSEKDMMTVYPAVTLVVNNGRDGSGVHAHAGQEDYSKESAGLDLTNGKNKYDFEEISAEHLNDRLIKQARYFDSDTLDKKIKRNLKTIFIDHKVPNVIAKIFKK